MVSLSIEVDAHDLLVKFKDYVLDHGASTDDGQGIDREWVQGSSVGDFEKHEKTQAEKLEKLEAEEKREAERERAERDRKANEQQERKASKDK
jgi:hypothetical protein